MSQCLRGKLKTILLKDEEKHQEKGEKVISPPHVPSREVSDDGSGPPRQAEEGFRMRKEAAKKQDRKRRGQERKPSNRHYRRPLMHESLRSRKQTMLRMRKERKKNRDEGKVLLLLLIILVFFCNSSFCPSSISPLTGVSLWFCPYHLLV